MASIHLKAGGTPAAPFNAWASAANTLAAGIASAAAGDDIICGTTFAEAVASYELTIPSNATTPSRWLCGTEGGTSGLTAPGTGAVFEATGTTMNIRGSFVADGITIRGSSASAVTLNPAATSGDVQMYRNSRFEITGAHPSASITLGSTTGGGISRVTLVDHVFKFGNLGQRINVNYDVAGFGGSIDSTLAAPTALFSLSAGQRGARMEWDGFDARNLATAGHIVGLIVAGGATANFRRWDLPAGWTGAPVAPGQLRAGNRVSLIDYSVGTSLFKAWIMDHAGTIKDEPTVKVTAHTHSYKWVSTANCSVPNPLRGLEQYVPLTGAAQTISVDIVSETTGLTDREIWIEVDYLNSTTSNRSLRVNDTVGPLTAGTPQATSATTWTTTGITTPVRQTLSVPVTAGGASTAIVRVVLAKPSTTVYVAALATVA